MGGSPVRSDYAILLSLHFYGRRSGSMLKISYKRVSDNFYFTDMKKINIQGKLNLNKETITRLNDQAMASVQGGQELLRTTCSSNAPVTTAGNSSPCNPQTCGSPTSTCIFNDGC